MAILNIVLRDSSVVFDALLRQIIHRIALLEQGAALVFLIRQNGLDRAVVPDIVSGGTFDSQLRQLLCDGGVGQTGKELSVDELRPGRRAALRTRY